MIKISNAEKFARMFLLFHKSNWTQDDRELWKEYSGKKEITTRVLGDMARLVLKEEEDKNRGGR